MELSDRRDVDVYFPEGTFCHSEGGTDYFCRYVYSFLPVPIKFSMLYFFKSIFIYYMLLSRKHQCLTTARGSRASNIPDLLVSQNARPDGELGVPKDMEAYFSLNEQVGEI